MQAGDLLDRREILREDYYRGASVSGAVEMTDVYDIIEKP